MERESTPWSGIRSRRLAGKLARGLSGKAELLHGNRRHSLGCATADAAIGGARRPDLWGGKPQAAPGIESPGGSLHMPAGPSER